MLTLPTASTAANLTVYAPGVLRFSISIVVLPDALAATLAIIVFPENLGSVLIVDPGASTVYKNFLAEPEGVELL